VVVNLIHVPSISAEAANAKSGSMTLTGWLVSTERHSDAQILALVRDQHGRTLALEAAVAVKLRPFQKNFNRSSSALAASLLATPPTSVDAVFVKHARSDPVLSKHSIPVWTPLASKDTLLATAPADPHVAPSPTAAPPVPTRAPGSVRVFV
jgi:hypothetical protein